MSEEKKLETKAPSTSSSSSTSTSSSSSSSSSSSIPHDAHVVNLDESYGYHSSGYRSFGSSGVVTHGHTETTFLGFHDELYRSIHTDHGTLGGEEEMRSLSMGSDADAFAHFMGGGRDTSGSGVSGMGLSPLTPDMLKTGSGTSSSTSSSLSFQPGAPSSLDPKFGSHFETTVTTETSTTTGSSSMPPYAPGGYIEPGYHYFSTQSPKAIIDTVCAVLQAAEIDCSVQHEKYRVRARHYTSGGEKIPFTVNVFSTHGYDHRFAVEWQRRQGSVIVFNQIYRAAKRAMESIAGMVEKEKDDKKEKEKVEKKSTSSSSSSTPQPPLVTDPLPPLGTSSTDGTKDTLKCLLQMASSRFVDVKSQALTAICDMTHNCSSAQTTLMLNEGAVKMCSEEMKNSVEDIHRVAVTTIANLTYRRSDVGSVVMENDGLNSLIKLTSSETPQVVRETARALANLATAVGKKMDNDELRGALRSLMCSGDPRARTHSHTLRTTLKIEAI